MAAKAIVLSHRGVADELGHIGDWMSYSGFSVERVYREDAPTIPDGDLLVVLGSPNSVATGHCLPPAEAEIDAVRAWVSADRPYVGVCFGAQVLARAFGGSVSRMERTYRKYVDFEVTESAPRVLEGRWAVWHEDAITAPSESEVLARLPHADTVFRIARAWGLQPHVEFDATIVRNLGDVVRIAEEEWMPLHRALSDDDAGHASRSRALLDHIAAEIL